MIKTTREIVPAWLVNVCAAVFSVWVLAGCNSSRDEIKAFMKCGIAATQLGQRAASDNISRNLQRYIDEKKIDGSARDAMFLAAEVRDEDLQLYKMSQERKFYTLVKVFNSSDCRARHGQEKIDLSMWVHYRYYLFYLFM